MAAEPEKTGGKEVVVGAKRPITYVVTYNSRTGFEAAAIGELFEYVEDLATLSFGSVIWMESFWSGGSLIHGFNRIQLMNVRDEPTRYVFSYKGGSRGISKDRTWHGIHVCKDEELLRRLVAKEPWALCTGGH